MTIARDPSFRDEHELSARKIKKLHVGWQKYTGTRQDTQQGRAEQICRSDLLLLRSKHFAWDELSCPRWVSQMQFKRGNYLHSESVFEWRLLFTISWSTRSVIVPPKSFWGSHKLTYKRIALALSLNAGTWRMGLEEVSLLLWSSSASFCFFGVVWPIKHTNIVQDALTGDYLWTRGLRISSWKNLIEMIEFLAPVKSLVRDNKFPEMIPFFHCDRPNWAKLQIYSFVLFVQEKFINQPSASNPPNWVVLWLFCAGD